MLDLGAGKFIDKAAEKSKVARELEKKAVEKGTKTGLAILWNQVKGVAVEPTKAIVEGRNLPGWPGHRRSEDGRRSPWRNPEVSGSG